MIKESETLLGLPIVRVDGIKGLKKEDIDSIRLGDFSNYIKYRIRKRGFWKRLWRRLTTKQGG